MGVFKCAHACSLILCVCVCVLCKHACVHVCLEVTELHFEACFRSILYVTVWDFNCMYLDYSIYLGTFFLTIGRLLYFILHWHQ